MMSDLIKREDAIKELSKVFANCEPCDKEEASDIAVTTIKELPSADRPQGNVDAVAILMREMHNLDQGYITIGEFDERIEPLSHLCYGRPQGEWVDAEIPLESGDTMPIQVCNLCKTFYPLAYTGGGHRFCPNCGARMKGADDAQ